MEETQFLATEPFQPETEPLGRRSPARSCLAVLLGAIVGGSALLAALTASAGWGVVHLTLSLLPAIGVLLLFVTIPVFALFHYEQRRLLTPRRWSLEDRGVVRAIPGDGSKGGSLGTLSYSRIHRVEEHYGEIWIYYRGINKPLILPARAFRNSEHAIRFTEALRRRLPNA